MSNQSWIRKIEEAKPSSIQSTSSQKANNQKNAGIWLGISITGVFIIILIIIGVISYFCNK